MVKYVVGILLCFSVSSCDLKPKKRASFDAVQPEQTTELKASIERGGLIYADFCMQCHLANGLGVPGTFPPLAASDWLTEKRKESIHAVKFGQSGSIRVNGVEYNGIMVPMGLSDEEIADVMNYIMNSWGNEQNGMVTPEEVAQIQK